MLAIDPGTKAIGWAKFDAHGLVECGVAATTCRETYLALSSLTKQIPGDADVWVECMSARDSDTVRRSQDILNVQWMGAAIAAALSYPGLPHPVTPLEWKGSVPKEIHHQRVEKRLTLIEKEIMDRCLEGVPSKLRHNAIDAIGIGLWRLGRKA